MNFMEAIQEMKKGKKVRRMKYQDDYLFMDEDEYICSLCVSSDNVLMSLDDFEATDWEIIDEDNDWDFLDDYSSEKPLNHPTTEDIKKCRDLILKDLFYCNSKNAIQVDSQLVIDTIEKRFGDLK